MTNEFTIAYRGFKMKVMYDEAFNEYSCNIEKLRVIFSESNINDVTKRFHEEVDNYYNS